MATDLPTLAINTIRTLSIDMVQKANSGHPGLPLGAAPMAYELWQNHHKHDPKAPKWFDRDRFVLSPGHGSALLYSLLHLTGYDLSMADLKEFRQWGSRTPGHPESHETPGVEATTGPLGQGCANAVGMAIAERYLAMYFNREGHQIIDHVTHAIVSDGDMMEGISHEAASIAGHLGLGKLLFLYDANDVTLDGPLAISMDEDVGARYAAYGWHVQHVEHGDTDLKAINDAIIAARAEVARPSIIVVKTTIGYGSPKAGKSSAHGSPLGDADVAATKRTLGWDPEAKFFVPEAASDHFLTAVDKGAKAHAQWDAQLAAYRQAFPDLAAQLDLAIAGALPNGWDAKLPAFTGAKPLATRVAGGKVLTALCAELPWLIGGDADLGGSTKTIVPGGNFEKAGEGRNLRFGIREHAMGAIANGLEYHGGAKTFTATFLTFSDYMRPAVRIAALSHLPTVFVWTHDSVGLGEDGPTHQPVEHMMALRAIPNLSMFRPADGNETTACWRYAMTRTDGPVGIALSRQDLPNQTPEAKAGEGAARGAYVLAEGSDVLIMATGSEVSTAMEARELLGQVGISARVVSMPCWELFEEQPPAYRESVLPKTQWRRISIEAGITLGWQKWVGDRGEMIGIDRYGASAPGELVLEKLGISASHVVEAAKRLKAAQ